MPSGLRVVASRSTRWGTEADQGQTGDTFADQDIGELRRQDC